MKKIDKIDLEKHLLVAIEDNVDPIITINQDETILTFNKGAEKLFGYSKEEIIGQKVSLIMPRSVANEHKSYIDQFLKTGIKRIIGLGREVHAIKRNGEEFPIFLSVSHYESEGEHYFVGSLKDLTEINEHQMLIRQIQRDAKIGGWYLDAKTMKTRWTEETYRIHGLPVGRQTDVEYGISFYAPEDQEEMERLIRLCLEEGIPFDDQFRFIDANNVHKYVRSTGKALRNSEGEIVGIRGTFRDISTEVEGKIRLEEEEHKSIQASKLAALGELAAGVAHEVNNPLGIIDGYVRIIRKHLEQKNYHAIYEKLDKIENAVTRATRIVKGLRRFARDGSIDNKEVISIKDLILESFNLVQSRLEKAKVDVKIEVDPKNLVEVNIVELGQVFINLFNNSEQAIRELDEKWIKISSKIEMDFVWIYFRDSGPGIPSELQHKIFQPFFTTKPVGVGTGLGLSISKGIIEAHGGFFQYDDLDSNTCFCILLPIVRKTK